MMFVSCLHYFYLIGSCWGFSCLFLFLFLKTGIKRWRWTIIKHFVMTFTKLLLNLSRFPPLATRHHTPRSGQTRGNWERFWGFGLPQKLALVWSGSFTTAVSSTGRFASWFWPSTLWHVSHPTSWVTNISTFQLCGLRQCFLPSLSLVFLLCL